MNTSKNVCFITEENKLALDFGHHEEDVVYYSELNEWETNNAYRNFSVKFLIDGYTDYKTSDREFRLNANSLLFATKQPGVTGSFRSKNVVKSICIDLRPSLLAEAYTILRNSNDVNLDNNFWGYFHYPNFYDRVYHPGNSLAAAQVLALHPHLDSCKDEDFSLSREWFLSLSEKIIVQELGTCAQLNNLKTVKQSTRKEILHRLLAGKAYIDENFLINPDIREIAQESSMSEFHFFRSFKQAFGITPYQYMLGKRLEHARLLIEKKQLTLGEIAVICSFPDLFTFSKAFKRYYGFPPSRHPLYG